MTAPTWATSVVHGALATHSVPPQPHITGEVDAIRQHERSRLHAAAGHARRLYPGALGELVERELRSYADFGVGPAENGLIARLAAQVLATQR